jgi:hypothetical protein
VTDTRSIDDSALAGLGHPSRHNDGARTVSATPGTDDPRLTTAIERATDSICRHGPRRHASSQSPMAADLHPAPNARTAHASPLAPSAQNALAPSGRYVSRCVLSPIESFGSRGSFEGVVGRVEQTRRRRAYGCWRVREWLGPKSRCFTMRAGHAGRQRRSWVPSRARSWGGAVGVAEHLPVDGVTDLAFE